NSIQQGVTKTKWRGRLDFITLSIPSIHAQQSRTIKVLVDGAHNSSSAAALRSYISSLSSQSEPRRTSFILALSHSPSKPPIETLTPLLKTGDRVAIVRFSDVADMPWVKPVPVDEVKNAVRECVGDPGEIWTWEGGEKGESGSKF